MWDLAPSCIGSLSCVFSSSVCRLFLSLYAVKALCLLKNRKTSSSMDRALCSSCCSHPNFCESGLHLLLLPPHCILLWSLTLYHSTEIALSDVTNDDLIAKFKGYLFSFHPEYFCCIWYEPLSPWNSLLFSLTISSQSSAFNGKHSKYCCSLEFYPGRTFLHMLMA